MYNCKMSAALSKGLGLQLFAQSKLTGKKPAAYLDISPLPTSTSHALVWWMLLALLHFCHFSTSMYYCTCGWKVKIGEVLEWDLDSYNVDMSKSTVCKHLGVDLLTLTTSVQELSIICKVLFWISYTAHTSNIGTSISVLNKKIKGPCSLVNFLVYNVVLTHALNNWLFYTPCMQRSYFC